MYIRLLAYYVILFAGMLMLPPVHAQELPFRRMFNPLPGLRYAAASWGDLDRDGLLDLALSGNRRTLENPDPVTSVFINRGDIYYKGPRGEDVYEATYDQLATTISPRWRGGIELVDYNGDGWLDLFVTGAGAGGSVQAQLFRNQGANGRTFLPQPVFSAPGLASGDAAWADYDNDGDEDLIMSGINAAGVHETILYQNRDAEQKPFLNVDAGIPGVAYGSLDWGDYDNDGDKDLLITGIGNDQTRLTRIYRNERGVFVQASVELDGLLFASASWGDYDADGDLDILLTGGAFSPFLLRGALTIYENTGGGFRRASHLEKGTFFGASSWGDFDNDGWLDILVVGGSHPVGARFGGIYRNERTGAFRLAYTFPGLLYSTGGWGDYDADNDLDAYAVGEMAPDTTNAFILRNESGVRNAPPSAPSGLTASVVGNQVTLAWAAATDDRTPSSGLTYNIRVGTAAGASNMVPSYTRPGTGFRLVSKRGNADHNTRWSIGNLKPGLYYGSVQAIDNSFSGSSFTAEVTFTIPGPS